MSLGQFHRLARVAAPVVATLVAVCLATGARAQSSSVDAAIQGTVVDGQALPVPNAQIEVVNPAISLRRRTLTDELGRYRFPLLPLGDYAIEVRATGLARVVRTGLQLNAGSVVTQDFQLAIASVEQTVSVERGTPVLEIARTDPGTTLSSNAVQQLPLVSRNSFNYVLLEPGISGHESAQFGLPSRVNTLGLTNRIHYQLDGSSNTQSDRAGVRLMPISNTWVEEVQQVDGGFQAEFGGSAGAVFNAVTRSGSNALHSEIGYLLRRTPFGARSPLLDDSEPDPISNMDNLTANAGLPLIRNKLFAFAGYEWVNRDMPQPITVDKEVIAQLGLPERYVHPIGQVQSNQFYIGRLDWQINDRNRVFFRYNRYSNDAPYAGSGSSLQLITQTYTMQDFAPAYAAQWVSAVGAGVMSELRFQVPAREVHFDRGAATQLGPAIEIPGVVSFGGALGIGYRFKENSPELAGNLTGTRGAHVWKFGASTHFILDDNTYPSYAMYTFASVDDYLRAHSGEDRHAYQNYQQTFGRTTLAYDSLYSSLFVEDTYRARHNLTFNLGLRWEIYRVPGGSDNAVLAWSRNFQSSTANFAPRFGLAWSPGHGQRTVIRVHGGLFYDPPQTDVYRRALQDDGRPRFFTLSIGPDEPYSVSFPGVFRTLPAGYGTKAADITTVDPTFRPLYASSWGLDVSRQVADQTSLTLGYRGVKGTAIPVYRNINLIESGETLADGRPIFGGARATTSYNNILAAESVGNSSYQAFTATLRRRVTARAEYSVSYTWSHSIDDAPEQNVVDSMALLPSDASNRTRDRANSLTDRRHALTAYGVVEPSFRMPRGWAATLANHNRLSFILTASSGDNFNPGSNRILNGDTSVAAALQRPLFAARNAVVGPALAQINLRYSRTLPIWERLASEFYVECSNVANHINVTGLDAIASVDAAGRVVTPAPLTRTAALAARTAQLGLRFSY